MPRPHIHQDKRRVINPRFVCRPSDSTKLMFDAPESEAGAVPSSQRNEFIDRLKDLLQQSPATMDGYLAEIRRKLSDGSYLTREVAEESAERMLDDGDLDSV